MATMVAPAHRSTKGTSVAQRLRDVHPRPARIAQPCPAKATPDNDHGQPIERLEQQRNAALALIEAAILRAGLKHSNMAADADVNPGLFSRGLNERDRKAFDARWLGPQPVEFWDALYKEIGLRYGFTDKSEIEKTVEHFHGIVAGLYGLLEQITKRTTVSE